MAPLPPLFGIVGPTASGKSELAMAIARRMPVEILVADSRQVYRGMDIGTAKPNATALATVPHHLVDLVAPDERFTVASWVKQARALIPNIAARGRVPLLVGGTGLYVSALVRGHDYLPQPAEAQTRTRLEVDLDSGGLQPLVARLRSVAPALASSIDRRNPRRVLRALERVQGGAAEPGAQPYGGPVRLVGIRRPREVLYARVDERARSLFANGLLDEVRALINAGYGPELRPMTGHGYAEAMRHLMGEWSLDEAIEVTARRTRQYAKRQLTWFRHQLDVVWLEADDRPGHDQTLVDAAEPLLRAGPN